MKRKVAVIVGSTRKDSLNRKMARNLIDLAPPSLDLGILEIGALPMYDQDLDKSPPTPWLEFRDRLKGHEGVLFVTPEYNRSVPGVLKNAIDVGSRPYGMSAWKGKVGAVMTLSPGALGGFGANHHLRQMLVFLDVPTMQQPEAYIGNAAELFDGEGLLAKESTRGFVSTFLDAYASWISMNAR